VYKDWGDSYDDFWTLTGNEKALAIAPTAPRAICLAWLVWDDGRK
jgi:hypothetical protein